MENFFQREFEREDIRIAFFGDHYASDVYASATCASSDKVKWDAIAVIEELAVFDRRLEMGCDFERISTYEYWGPNYFFDIDSST